MPLRRTRPVVICLEAVAVVATALWCPQCALPSGIRVLVARHSEDVEAASVFAVTSCQECRSVL